MKYDFAVIGAGPAGCVAAKKAAGAGLKTLLVEKKNWEVYALTKVAFQEDLLQAAKTCRQAWFRLWGECGRTELRLPQAHAHKGVMDKMRDGIAG